MPWRIFACRRLMKSVTLWRCQADGRLKHLMVRAQSQHIVWCFFDVWKPASVSNFDDMTVIPLFVLVCVRVSQSSSMRQITLGKQKTGPVLGLNESSETVEVILHHCAFPKELKLMQAESQGHPYKKHPCMKKVDGFYRQCKKLWCLQEQLDAF